MTDRSHNDVNKTHSVLPVSELLLALHLRSKCLRPDSTWGINTAAGLKGHEHSSRVKGHAHSSRVKGHGHSSMVKGTWAQQQCLGDMGTAAGCQGSQGI